MEVTEEFEAWSGGLDAEEQDSVDFVVELLVREGPMLSYPYSSDVSAAKKYDIRELRIQHQGRPYRVLYVFDPRRHAVLLLGATRRAMTGGTELMCPRRKDLFRVLERVEEAGVDSMKKWSELRSRIPAERRQATDRRVASALKEMPLYRLREARRLTQKQIAEAMHIDQSRVSKIERRTDVYVSTLRNFVSASGGELELVARFPEGRVKILSFSDGELGDTVEEEI